MVVGGQILDQAHGHLGGDPLPGVMGSYKKYLRFKIVMMETPSFRQTHGQQWTALNAVADGLELGDMWISFRNGIELIFDSQIRFIKAMVDSLLCSHRCHVTQSGCLLRGRPFYSGFLQFDFVESRNHRFDPKSPVQRIFFTFFGTDSPNCCNVKAHTCQSPDGAS